MPPVKKKESIISEKQLQMVVNRVLQAIEYERIDLEWLHGAIFTNDVTLIDAKIVQEVGSGEVMYRFADTSQTDPISRGEWYWTATSLSLARAATADWATLADIIVVDMGNGSSAGTVGIRNTKGADANMLNLGSVGATTGGITFNNTTSNLDYNASNNTGLRLRANVGGTMRTALIIASGAHPQARSNESWVDCNASIFLRSGPGNATYPVLAFGADPDTGLFYPGDGNLAIAVGGAESVRWTTTLADVKLPSNLATTTTVPLTTTLAASQIRFVVDSSDQLICYFNDAGVIRSLTIGTLV